MSTGEYKSSGSLIGVTSYEFKATPNTKYTILLSVSDKAGNSTDYETQIVTTPAAPDEKDKETPKVGTITKAKAGVFNTILVEWTAATDNKTPQEKLRYQVVYKEKGSSEEKTTELTENKLSYILPFLKKYKTYIIKVRVVDEDGNTAEYAPKEVTTGKIPGPNGDLDVTRFVQLTSNGPIDSSIYFELKLEADYDHQKGVWIDFNNNGQWDDGIDVIPEKFKHKISYPIKSKAFTVYGKISHFYSSVGNFSDVKLYNPELKELTMEDSKLTSVMIPSSDALEILNLVGNPLTSLQIGNVPNLEYLNAGENELTSLDISAYPKLKKLRVSGTPLSSLDASKNPLLKEVWISLYKGKGLNGKPLEDFLRSLPAGEGKIFLDKEQETPTVKGILKEKGWSINKF